MNGGVSSSSPRTFAMDNESEVIALLKEIRHSNLDNETKDDIRDVVFELRTKHNDALLAELQLFVDPLQIKIAGSQPVIAESAETPVVPKANSFKPSQAGASRPVPTFGNSAPVKSTPVEPVETPVVEETVEEEVEEKVVQSAVESVPEVKEEVEKPEPVAVPEPVVETKEEVLEETVEAAPETEEVPKQYDDPMARIREIKAEVNAAVGNPVNLIDANNEVGREYMNSLLEAMKAASGGGNVAPTMQRLEKAYAAVQKTLESKPTIDTVLEAAPEKVVEKADSTPGVASAEPVVSEPQVVEPEKSTPVTEPVSTPEPVKPSGLQSLADQVTTAKDIEEKVEIEKDPVVIESGDPLQSKEVDSGLEQLLSEWTLFKSSGLFGTGPSGIDHKLYKELRNLKMNAVMAGRFEGATPEVRQSLSDYMNGWRYEQGMTHDMQETFEHYLRRVIKAIIDKRK